MPQSGQPPSLGTGLGRQAAWGSAEQPPVYFGGKRELWLGPTGCRCGTGKATPGMQKEKLIREIQQLK